MADNLCRPTGARYSRPRLSVVRQFSEAAGIKPSTAAQLISGNGKLVDRLVKILHACRTSQNPALADRIMRPLLEAWCEPPVVQYGPHLLRDAVKADAQEDVVRTEWQLGEADLDRYLRALDREIAEKCLLRESLMKCAGR